MKNWTIRKELFPSQVLQIIMRRNETRIYATMHKKKIP